MPNLEGVSNGVSVIEECGLDIANKRVIDPKKRIDYFYSSQENYENILAKSEIDVKKCSSNFVSDGSLASLKKKLDCISNAVAIVKKPRIKRMTRSSPIEKERNYIEFIGNSIFPFYAEKYEVPENTVLRFAIALDKKGRIYELKLLKPSGNKNLDFSVIKKLCMNTYSPIPLEIIKNYDVLEMILSVSYSVSE